MVQHVSVCVVCGLWPIGCVRVLLFLFFPSKHGVIWNNWLELTSSYYLCACLFLLDIFVDSASRRPGMHRGSSC